MIKSPVPISKRRVITRPVVVDPELDALRCRVDQASADQTIEKRIDRAKAEAAAIVRKAREKAQAQKRQMAQEARAAKESERRAIETGRKKGYEEGFSSGSAEGKKAYADRIAAANRLVDQARTAYRDYLSRSEPDMLKLAMAVAEKILDASVAEEEEKWVSLAAKAVREVRDQKTIKLIVPPVHFEMMNQRRHELNELIQDGQIFIYVDSELHHNDCIIETAFGRIDAGIDSQLSVIKKKLTEMMEEDGR
ncbi:MAG: flagellar assembly protein FliH [Sporolactobacillus sp.]|nr:flagellar assembly protein FliH [Sporolactobacillus sp.]